VVPEIALKRPEDTKRLENYIGRTVKLKLNPKWSIDRKTDTIYITPTAPLKDLAGETIGVLGTSGKYQLVIKTPNRSAGVKWWRFFGSTTYHVRPEARSDVVAPSFGSILVIQRAEREPTVKGVVNQMARVYAIQQSVLNPFHKSWAEISVGNIRRGGLIDAQLYDMRGNKTWVRGAVLSMKDKFGVDPVANAMGVQPMDVLRGNIPAITSALNRIIRSRKFWKQLVDDMNVPKSISKAVINANSIDERVGALLVAERLSAIRDLRKIRALL